MRGCEGPEIGDALVVFEAGDGSEGGSECVSVAVVHTEVGDVGEEAVVAANEAAALVEDGGAVEPVAGGEEDIVEVLDLGAPVVVELVEVEAEEAGVCRTAVGVGVSALHQVGCPEGGHGEVVGGVLPSLEPLVFGV